MIFGKKKIIEAQAKELEELQRQLSLAEEKNSALETELNGLKSKELAIAKAITDANLAAEGILQKAQEESGKSKEKAEKELADAESMSSSIRSSAEDTATRVVAAAEEKAATVISEAEKTSAKLVSEAENKKEDILAEAETKCQQRLRETEDEVRSYAEILVKLNENMKEQAKLAQEASERYAAFYAQMSSSIPGIMSSITAAQLPETTKKAEQPILSATAIEGKVITVSDILVQEPLIETVSTEDILNSVS